MNENKQSIAIGQAVNEHDSTLRAKRVVSINSTGAPINPAAEEYQNPTERYKITDLDSGSPQYYGYADAEGAWYIMELTNTTGRYVKGDSDYETNWTNRASLTYDYFFNVF